VQSRRNFSSHRHSTRHRSFPFSNFPPPFPPFSPGTSKQSPKSMCTTRPVVRSTIRLEGCLSPRPGGSQRGKQGKRERGRKREKIRCFRCTLENCWLLGKPTLQEGSHKQSACLPDRHHRKDGKSHAPHGEVDRNKKMGGAR